MALSLPPVLLVALGGAAGSSARYLVSAWCAQTAGTQRFPLGTFVVNVLGCLLAGVLASCAGRLPWPDAGTRLLLMTGLLGGFTTFSAFGLETAQLLRRGDWWLACGYAGGSLVLGVAAVLAGLWLSGAPGGGRGWAG